MRVLLSKGKTRIVDGREFTISKPKKYVVDEKEDFNCAEGNIKKEDLLKPLVKTNKGMEFYSFPASFNDLFFTMERDAQIITLKDASYLLSACDLGKESVVVEGGTGSGALACFLGRHVKEVHSYDVEKKRTELGKRNAERLGIKNIQFTPSSLAEVQEKEVDAAIIDMPTPLDVLEHVVNAVKVGGYIAAYLPSTTQVETFVEAVREKEELFYLKTVELIQRTWKVKGKAVRPVSDGAGHTAFLILIRKVH